MKNTKSLKTGLLVLIIISLSGCGKPFIGQTVDTDHEVFCKIYDFPAECVMMNQIDFMPHARIEQLHTEGDYHIDGYFDASQGSFSSWRDFARNKSTFRMIFVSGNKIVDNKNLSLSTTSLSEQLKFSFNYHSDVPLDAVAFSYSVYMAE